MPVERARNQHSAVNEQGVLTTIRCLVLAAFALAGCGTGGEQRQEDSANDSAREAIMQTVISKDGTRIAYDKAGNGPALILVNGALSDRSSSSAIARLLAPHF